MTSRKNINIFYFNGVNVAKHWHVAERGICHLWLPCWGMYWFDTNNSTIVIQYYIDPLHIHTTPFTDEMPQAQRNLSEFNTYQL